MKYVGKLENQLNKFEPRNLLIKCKKNLRIWKRLKDMAKMHKKIMKNLLNLSKSIVVQVMLA